MPLPADIHEPETDLVRERAIDHVQCWRRRKECVVIALSLTILAAVLAATTLVLNHQFAAATGT